jgi:hypothetical protein
MVRASAVLALQHEGGGSQLFPVGALDYFTRTRTGIAGTVLIPLPRYQKNLSIPVTWVTFYTGPLCQGSCRPLSFALIYRVRGPEMQSDARRVAEAPFAPQEHVNATVAESDACVRERARAPEPRNDARMRPVENRDLFRVHALCHSRISGVSGQKCQRQIVAESHYSVSRCPNDITYGITRCGSGRWDAGPSGGARDWRPLRALELRLRGKTAPSCPGQPLSRQPPLRSSLLVQPS